MGNEVKPRDAYLLDSNSEKLPDIVNVAFDIAEW
ncbi:Uncharacterised protein [Clostridium paraputrificum]|nr:Uncharacterised protein [Clostridium paraputrificum]